jgi:GAF domain-containing protein
VTGAAQALWRAVHAAPFVRTQLRFAVATLGAETASVMLLDEAGEHLVFAASAGANAERYTGAGDPAAAMRIRLAGGTGLNAIAATFGRPVVKNGDDPRHNSSIDRAVGTRTHSLYACPLSGGGRIVGTLSAINAHGGGPFTPEDMQAMDGAAEALNLWLDRAVRALADAPQDLRAS